MTDPRIIELTRARKFAESGELDDAWRIVQHYLSENPHDIEALVVATFTTRRARNLPVAYHFARHITEIAPSEAAGWINYGQICNDMWLESEAERAYKKGLEIARRDHDKSMLLHNWSALMIDQGRFDEGLKLAERALSYNPESRGARANVGFCQLAKRQWADGWKNYAACLGMDTRRKVQYRDEPEWDGSPNQTVVLYGEQGIGDEICFASMVPDAVRVAKRVILDVDARLAGLFARSFPAARVYGTRNAKPGEARWNQADWNIDASLAIAQVGQFFRLKDEDFPGTPYLVADPDRVTMWKALWAKKGKPVIGIAWTGGIRETGAKYRRLTLEQLLPIFQAVDAHWVCLEYKDRSADIAAFLEKHPDIDLKQYRNAVLTDDYDDTAGLVASLDGVISLPTAVVHLAAAIGTPCIAMKSPKSCWKFHGGLAFHPQVRLIENDGSWTTAIREGAKAVRAFGRMRVAA